MDDANLIRMERQIEDLAIRLRSVENVGTPRVQELRADVREVRHKIEEMDVEGTAVTRERLKAIESSIVRIEAYLTRQDDDKRADRRAVLVAILGAAVAIVLAIVQVITK